MERIIVENVSKRFRIGFKRNQGFLARLIDFFSGKEPKKEIWALKNVSFNAKAGEVVGIIGENGSGKSTLLRAIAGIYDYSGEIKTNGKIISLINLNAGLQSRLTMKDNIFLCCSLFGISQKGIKQKFNSIVEFSELGNFVDTKLYQFSNGMLQRLAFSIAAHCNPEILLLDEVFEVGDESFRIKSANKIKEITKKNGTGILVSHDLEMIEKHCDKVVLIDKGEIIKEGKAKEIVKRYKK